MASSSISKFSHARSEPNADELRSELTALQKTKEVLLKFLEVVQTVSNDLNTMTNNYAQLNQVNKEWTDILTLVNEN